MGADTVFVTGGNGFLGAALVGRLLARGHHVRALLRPNADDRLLHHLPIERITGDVLEPDAYRAALTGCVALYHLASSYTHDPARLAAMELVNIEGTRRILSAGLDADIPRLLHTSTIGVIGQPSDGALATEDVPFNLPNPTAYVRSKRAGEQIADEMAAAGGPIVIVHPTGMLGPGDWRPSASGRLVLDALRGHTPRYPGGGVNWCPVEDVAEGMILAVERGTPGRHYILGHGAGNLDLDGFLDLFAQAAGHPLARPSKPGLRTWLRRLSQRPGAEESVAPTRLTCDPSRAVNELDMPQSSLLVAARAEASWYDDNGYIAHS